MSTNAVDTSRPCRKIVDRENKLWSLFGCLKNKLTCGACPMLISSALFGDLNLLMQQFRFHPAVNWSTGLWQFAANHSFLQWQPAWWCPLHCQAREGTLTWSRGTGGNVRGKWNSKIRILIYWLKTEGLLTFKTMVFYLKMWHLYWRFKILDESKSFIICLHIVFQVKYLIPKY